MVVIGGSAGGIEVLRELVGGLPADLPAAVLVVIHLPGQTSGALPRILDRCGVLPARPAEHDEPLRPGRIYVAVPDHHLLIHQDRIWLSRSPRQNRARPAVDVLFRSAARWSGPRTIGVVLSGALDDGAAGLAAIRARGGVAVVQDPGDAMFDGMPRAALAAIGGNASTVPAGRLAGHVVDLVGQAAGAPIAPPDEHLIVETDMAEAERPIVFPADALPIGEPVGLGCPECTGGMSIVERGASRSYRCHVGHVYSPHTLLAAQQEKTEAALWTTVSFLEEQAAIHQHLAARAAQSGAVATVEHQRAAAERATQAADTIREHAQASMADKQ